jgi:NAD(P)-dependent dehydrogenase (short-subunit alcohol dehydrogenase family)
MNISTSTHQEASMRHKGKTVIVTAAGSGIGAATARRFAAEGADVIVSDISHDAATAVAADIGGSALAIRCRVGSADDTEATVAAAVERFGTVDVMINNAAGGTAGGPVELVGEDAWDEMFDVNVKGGFLFVKHTLPLMRANGGGSILFTASLGAKQGTAGLATYGATKAAIVNLTKSMALEFAADGVRVNAVCPGAVLTPGLTHVPVDALAQRIPFKRLGQPEEIASVFSFLASDDASYITGQAIDVDGGLGAGMGPVGPPPSGPPPSR